VFEPDAGMLAAARAVALMVLVARQARRPADAVARANSGAAIDLDGDRPVVVTDRTRSCGATHRLSQCVAEKLLPELASLST